MAKFYVVKRRYENTDMIAIHSEIFAGPFDELSEAESVADESQDYIDGWFQIFPDEVLKQMGYL